MMYGTAGGIVVKLGGDVAYWCLAITETLRFLFREKLDRRHARRSGFVSRSVLRFLGFAFLLGVGTLLFLALISYSPRDLPSWVPWSYLSPPNRPAQNFIGPFGAIFASVFYLLIGAASYLFAAVLLGFGAAKLFHPALSVVKRSPWIALFIVSGACLLHLQHYALRSWHAAFNIQGP